MSTDRRARPASASPSRRPPAALAIDLALQGGGSHGAFTWGVLDRLLEDETLAFDGISGTSAGALNAAVLATGWFDGGRAGARAALRAFWLDVADSSGSFGGQAAASPWAPWPAGGGDLRAFNLDGHPAYLWFQEMTRLFSPYQLNPLGLDPLRDLVARHVRTEALARGTIEVFVNATAVKSGRARVFRRQGVTIDALIASACLPQLFRAVVIDGEPYWDGGYSGNPALWPLIYHTRALDLLLVKVDPLVRPQLPDTAAEIADRVNEITFNSGLIGEMRAIGFVQKLVREGRLDPGEYKNLRLHMVADEQRLAELEPSSKMNTARAFRLELHELGRAAAEHWWRENRRHLGRRATLDLRTTFLDPDTSG
jgi:NTE family protein